MKKIAIIPARGGSKRIPGKNIVDFLGKPMIAWTIEAALDSNCFDRVMVSTDDPEIAAISRALGAEVPVLRPSHSDDISPVSEATIAALIQASEVWREKYGVVAQLMANCPLRNAVDIQRAMAAFERNGRSFQLSCFRFGWMNPWWAAIKGDSGSPTWIFDGTRAERSQDLPTLYCPTGAIWIAKADSLLEAGTFYGEGHRLEELGWRSALDIDDYYDMEFGLAVAKTETRLS